jgi:hypothetical protein
MKKLLELAKNPSGFDSLDNYAGDLPDTQWHVVVTRSRDAEILTECNWHVALTDLGGESESVQIFRFGHWACGWWEALCVAKGGEQFAKGQELHDSLEEYPILDEQAFSEMEHDEATRYWAEGYSPKDRVEYLRECGEIHFADFGDLLQCVRGTFPPYGDDGYHGIIGY